MTQLALAGLRRIEARDINGRNNNPNNAEFGAIDQTFTRIAANSYTDGVELMARARPLDWDPAGTMLDAGIGRPVFINNPNDEIPQGRAGADVTVDLQGNPLPPGQVRIPLTDDLRFVNQPTGDLPQARDISNAVFAQLQDANGNDIPRPNTFGVNDFALFFGQALTHDMVETQVNVTAVSIPASTGIGWTGGNAIETAGTQATALQGAFLVRVNPQTGQAILQNGQPIRLFGPEVSLQDQIAALKAGSLSLGALTITNAQGQTVTIPAVTPQQQAQVADALVNHQALSLGAPFALQRTPGVYEDQDRDGVAERQQANTETAFLDLGNVYGKVTSAVVARDGIDLTNPAILRWADAGVVNGVAQVRVEVDTSILLRARAVDGSPSALLLTSDDVADGVRDGQDLLPTYGEVNAASGLFRDVGATTVDEATQGMGRIFDPTLEAFFDLDRFAAGDQRVNQNAATITQQTVWMRNHNWHVEQLQAALPNWTAEEIFQAARALNEADYQKAVYDEYLPGIIGQAGVAMMGDYTGYKAHVNPAIINEWTTVAFRFGHDQSSNFVSKLREDGSIAERVLLIESFTRAGAATAVADAAELDQWIRGQLAATHEAIDGYVVEGNRGELFGVTVSPVTGQPVVNDLTVFDITRGRDHGVNSYIKLREALKLDDYVDQRAGEDGTAAKGGAAAFDRWAADNNVSADRLAALKQLYGNDFAKFDAYVGVLLERPYQDSQLGITSTILVAMQFAAVRDGDRFWYENRFGDNPELLAMIEQGSMAEVLRRTTGIEHIYRDAFMAHERIGGTDQAETLTGTAGRDLLIGFGGNDHLLGLTGKDDLYGGGGDDRLEGGDGEDLLFGEIGRDTLLGGAGADTLKGGEGDDRLFGDAGRDELHGGDGDDRLEGGDAEDLLLGAAGRDTLIGGASADTLDGAAGDDRLFGGDDGDRLVGGAGNDALQGDAGDDTLSGGEGDDTLSGGQGRDSIDGGAGRDQLNGDGGNDTLLGGTESDTLFGSFGNELLDGGAGRDVMSGGLGNDSFRFSALDDGVADRDRVLDFDRFGDDRIVLDVADPAAAASYRVATRGQDVIVTLATGDVIELVAARSVFDLRNPSSEIELI